MNLEELQKHWQKFGEEDPLWAILTEPDMQHNNWNPEAFFQRGVREMADVFQQINDIHISLSHTRALDFGCGVGRLTQAIAARFEETHGVDIAPSMIEAARHFNQFGDRCHYHVNDKNHLRLFADHYFDFIYTVMVLQHMHPRYSTTYIAEFLRILKPGGVLAFQLPSDLKVEPQPLDERQQPTATHPAKYAYLRPFPRLYHRLRQILRLSPPPKPFEPRMEMYGIPKDEVVTLLKHHEAIVLHIASDEWAGPPWNSYTYFVTKSE